MNAEYINPFLNATVNVLKTMAATEITVGKPAVKSNPFTFGDVTGVIGMASNELTGNMILSFSKPAILGILKRMLMEEFNEINNEVIDAVGELTNMICGGAKTELNSHGHVFDMATPIVIQGSGVKINQITNAQIITIPFETQDGKFVVEANLASPKQSKA